MKSQKKNCAQSKLYSIRCCVNIYIKYLIKLQPDKLKTDLNT